MFLRIQGNCSAAVAFRRAAHLHEYLHRRFHEKRKSTENQDVSTPPP
jgi:hypothetical protein